MFPVYTFIALLFVAEISDAKLYKNCYECFGEICCDDPITDIDTLTWSQTLWITSRYTSPSSAGADLYGIPYQADMDWRTRVFIEYI